jgi:hypothetical protein
MPLAMKSLTLPGALLLLAIGLPPAVACAEEPLPKMPPLTRYNKMVSQSPFAPPTDAPVVKAPEPVKMHRWADSLAVVTVMQQGADYLATVLDIDTKERFLVSTDPTVKNNRDIALTGVKWAVPAAQTQVTLRKGTEFAPVKFDPGAVAAVAPSLPAGIPPNQAARPLPTPNRPAQSFNPPAGQTSTPNAIRRQPTILAQPPPIPGAPPLINNSPQTRLPPPPTIPGRPAVADDDDDD